MITQRTKLDMRPGGVMPVVHVSQYDNDAAALIFDLYDGGELFTVPTGSSVLLNGLKPDNYGFSYQAASISGNTVVCNLTTQMTAVAGAVVCELRVRNGAGTQIIGSCNFILQVEAAALTDDTIISDTMIPLIEQAVEIASNLDRYITQTQSNAEVSAAAATTATNAANSAQIVDANVTGLYNSIEEAKTNANTAAANANSVAAQVAQQAASGAFKGDKGDKGDSGVTTPVWGMYTMYVDESTGDLWLVTNGEYGSEYWFRYDDETGNLYYCTPEYVEKTVSGDLIEITDAANLGSLHCKVAFSPIQSGAGDPSPTNIRPISGRTGLTVTRSGKNLLNYVPDTPSGTASGLTWSTENGVLTVNGTATANQDVGIQLLTLRLPTGIEYAVSGGVSGGSTSRYFLGIGISNANNVHRFVYDTGNGATFTLAEDEYIYRVYINVKNGVTVSNFVFRPMIRLATITDDTYEPYTGQTYPVTWESIAGTVYGGTLDVVSGVLTVDRAVYSFAPDRMILTGPLSGYTRKYVYRNGTVGGFMPPIDSNEVTKTVCNILPAISRAQAATENVIGVFQYNSESANEIRFSFDRESAYDSASKIYDLGLTVAIPLKEPTTYQLTPTEVRTILGGNNIYTDAGTIEALTYVAEIYEED